MKPSQPKKPKKLELSEADLQKVRARRKREELAKISVTPELKEISEFGLNYGWDALKEALSKNTTLTRKDIQKLNAGARIVLTERLINNANATFIAVSSAKQKKPSTSFNKAMKDFIKATKLDI